LVVLVVRVDQLELGLLGPAPEGIARLELLQVLDRLGVVARSELVLGLGIQSVGRPADRGIGLAPGLAAGDEQGERGEYDRQQSSRYGRVHFGAMHSDSHDYIHAPVDDPGAADEAAEPAEDAEFLVVDGAHGAGERLDRFLARMLPQFSRTRLQRWIAIGAVRCDQRPVAASTRLTGLERIEVEPQPLEAEQAFVAEPVPLDIVHEDADLVVLDKPAGLVVHPAAGNWHGTLLHGLLHHDARQAELPRAGIVHRLDKDTSGLMVVARSESARMSLAQQLADRTMSRRYLAIVRGKCPGA